MPSLFRALRFTTGAILLAHLAGCLMIPHPRLAHREPALCHTLALGVPAFIAPGTTTRADVLQELGTPSGTAADGSWLVYGCAVNEGGTGWFFIAGGGYGATAGEAFSSDRYTFRRLIVNFSAVGTVSSSRIETRTCQMKSGPLHDTAPCLDATGLDLTNVEDLPFLTGEGEFVVFEHIFWFAKDTPIDAALVITSKSLIVRTGCNYRLTQDCDLRQTTSEVARVPLADILSAQYRTKMLLLPIVSLRLRDGTNREFTAQPRHRGELSDLNHEVVALLQSRLQANSAASDEAPKR